MSRKYKLSTLAVSFLVAIMIYNTKALLLTDGLINGLIAVAAISFGILGAWLSLLKPTEDQSKDQKGLAKHTVSNSKNRSNRSRNFKLALRLSPVIKDATYALASVLLLRLVASLHKPVGEVLSSKAHLVSKAMNFCLVVPANGFNQDHIRDFTGLIFRLTMNTAIISLYCFEILILIVTLLPILFVEKEDAVGKDKNDFTDDAAGKYDRTIE